VRDREAIDHQPGPIHTKEIDMSVTIENPAGATAIRPLTIPKAADAELEALRARIAAARWPDKETVTDDSHRRRGDRPHAMTNPAPAAARSACSPRGPGRCHRTGGGMPSAVAPRSALHPAFR
jgi:hypothetical protein